MSADFRVVTIDLRGCGVSEWRDCEDFISSSAEDIKNIINELSLKDFTLAGWSLGGMVAMKLASELKSGLAALVLISTSPKFVKSEDFPSGAEKAELYVMKKDMKKDPVKPLEAFKESLLLESEKSEANLGRFKEIFSKIRPQSPEVLIKSLESLERVDLRSGLKNINCPTLILHGTKDDICPFGAAEYLRDNIKDSKLAIFQDAGHMLALTRAEEFLCELKNFLKN